MRNIQSTTLTPLQNAGTRCLQSDFGIRHGIERGLDQQRLRESRGRCHDHVDQNRRRGKQAGGPSPGGLSTFTRRGNFKEIFYKSGKLFFK